MGASDSIPARLLPFSIVREGNLDLDEFTWLRPHNSHPYFLRPGLSGHEFSVYPVLTPVVLSPLYLPVVAWLAAHHIPDDDVRFRLATVVMERISAALLSGLSVTLLYLALCTLTSSRLALAIALVYAFGTSTWAISSQALWQHAATQLGLAGLSLCLLTPASRRNTAAAGGWATFAMLGRPTMAIFAVVALVYVWRERRAYLLAFLAVPVAGAAWLLWYNVTTFGSFKGGYADVSMAAPSLVTLLGLLVSPNRGLFVFTPAAVFALPAIIFWRRQRPAWLAYLAIGVVGSLLLYSAFEFWWAGACYGPRYLSDALPAIALLSVPTVQHLRGALPGRAALLILAVWGVLVQTIGVYCDDGSWNIWPSEVDAQRPWDWRDTHIARAVQSGWHGTDLAPLLWQALVDPHPALLRPLAAAELGGTITLETAQPLHYRHGGGAQLDVTVTNRGTATWPAFSDFGFIDCALLHRWWADGTIVQGVGGPLPLPRNLGAGENLPVHARLELPRRPGTYELELILVQRLSVNGAGSGGAAVRIPVQIE